MADKNKDMVTREVLEKASKDMLQEVSEHLYNYVPYTEDEIAEIFDLDETTAKSLSKVINDEYIAKNKVFSNEHTMELLNQNLAEANKFTAEQIANSGNLKRKIVTSTSEVVDETILYLILTDSTNNIYTQYMLIDGVVTSLSTTQINLSDYLLLSDFNAEIDKYAKKDSVVSQSDVVGDLTTLSSNQVLSTQGISDELDKKIDKTSITDTIDSSSTSSQVPSALTLYNKTKNMCTTTVADVPITNIAPSDTTTFVNFKDNSRCTYCVRNGICYVTLWDVKITKDGEVSPDTILPKCGTNRVGAHLSGPSEADVRSFVCITEEGKLYFYTKKEAIDMFLYGSFSYPVAES